jgi:hypothetical protein
VSHSQYNVLAPAGPTAWATSAPGAAS